MEVGVRVRVKWLETGDSFLATVKGLNVTSLATTYLVEYDEKVRDKIVREDHVTDDRLEPLSADAVRSESVVDRILSNKVNQ
jgi:hypothetical protein